MNWAKYAADFLTGLRPVLAAAIAVVGVVDGKHGLSTVILLLLAAWTTDWLDGPLARLSGSERRTWVGDHDLAFDIVVGVALGIYLGVSGLAPLWLVLLWIIAWMTVMFVHDTLPKPFGAIFQGPIYIWFGIVSLIELPGLGVWLWVWAVLTNVITYKRLFKESLPQFFEVLRKNLYFLPRKEGVSEEESKER
jgi:phosphatidylglycerophosphate synthase